MLEKQKKAEREEEGNGKHGVDIPTERVHRVVSAPTVVGKRVDMPSDDAITDVEMFECYQSQSQSQSSTVMKAVDMTRSSGSRAYLESLLRNPTSDVRILELRREVLRRMEVETHETVDDTTVNDHAYGESDVFWALEYAHANATGEGEGEGEEHGNVVALYDVAYFTSCMTRSMNASPRCLTALNWYRMSVSPLLGLAIPILYAVVPYMVIVYKMRHSFGVKPSFGEYVQSMVKVFREGGGFADPFGTTSVTSSSRPWITFVSCVLSLFMYIQSTFNGFEIARTLSVVCRSLNARVTRMTAFLRRASIEVRARWDDGIRQAFFADMPSWDEIDAVTKHFSELRPSDMAYDRGVDIGRGLCAFRAFDHRRIRLLMRAFYATDCLMSIVRLRGTSCRGRFAEVRFSDEQETPELSLQGLRHPCLNPKSAVENDVTLGTSGSSGSGDDAKKKSMLLTGPNAGGKSTLMKATLVAVLMAQSLCTVPCSGAAYVKPFAFINSNVNVPDTKGVRSLFEEEMHRARANLRALRKMDESNASADKKDRQTALIVIDEIFSSTNPLEGVAAAYSVAKHIASSGCCAAMISTHYTYLCRLGNLEGGRLFANRQMPVHIGTDPKTKKFSYPYKLRPGVCSQHIALELLRENGFDEGITEDAIRVKTDLSGLSNRRSRRVGG